jgi:putative hydrolase
MLSTLRQVEAPSTDPAARSPIEALDRVVYLLDRALAPSPKVRAFSRARQIVAELGDDQVAELVRTHRLQELPGIGTSTGAVIRDAVEGRAPAYLTKLEASSVVPLSAAGEPYRQALLGDCHLHSEWSDGGATIEAMARTALALGHQYLVLTDHSPRLTVAHGLDRDRLLQQLQVTGAQRAAPVRILPASRSTSTRTARRPGRRSAGASTSWCQRA